MLPTIKAYSVMQLSTWLPIPTESMSGWMPVVRLHNTKNKIWDKQQVTITMVIIIIIIIIIIIMFTITIRIRIRVMIVIRIMMMMMMIKINNNNNNTAFQLMMS